MDHLLPCIDSSSTENGKGRSDVWEHFTKEEPYSEKKAKCNYCGNLIKYLGGTSGTRNHLMRCKENPNREAIKRQKLLSSSTKISVSPSPTISKFDQNASRMKLVKMFVKSELPFQFVENEDIRDFVWSLHPRFEVSSCTILRREIWELYEEEKAKLKMFLSKQYERGVFTGKCGTNLDHGVVVVGYESENGVDYWLVRNSWGSGWGEDDYFKMECNVRSSSTGKCGIAMEASYPAKYGLNSADPSSAYQSNEVSISSA